MNTTRKLLVSALLLAAILTSKSHAAEVATLSDTIEKVKPSVVAVGTFQKTRRPPAIFRGTGFVIGKGQHVVTNAHVLPEKLDADKREYLAVFTGKGQTPDIREATKVAEDLDYDVAVLKISGEPLAPLKLGDSQRVREGEFYALTGFPIGMVLGLHPVTHRAMIAAITPIVIPQLSAQQIEKKVLARLISPYNIFQLDATAYPGNSGSPLYDTQTGQVVGIVNKVFVQSSRESAIEKPSGISYAIQIGHLKDLLKKAGVE